MRVAANGIELEVDVRGDGPPVLLLHGLSQQRHFWDPVVRRLRARPVAAMGQRGHGNTGTPLASDFSVDACAADALAVIDRLGWARAVVVGHSWGASVALAAAAAPGDRVAAAVLVDGGLWSPSALGPRDQVREALRPPALGLPADFLLPFFDKPTTFLRLLQSELRGQQRGEVAEDSGGLRRAGGLSPEVLHPVRLLARCRS